MKKQKICSRDHRFEGSGPCPACWPGYDQRTGQNKYLSEITLLLKKNRPKFATEHRLEFKNVFGAVGGYVNGKIFVSCGRFGVAFKLPPDTLGVLFKDKKAKHLTYFPNGHTKKEYAILSKQILENKLQLKKIVDESITFVLK